MLWRLRSQRVIISGTSTISTTGTTSTTSSTGSSSTMTTSTTTMCTFFCNVVLLMFTAVIETSMNQCVC